VEKSVKDEPLKCTILGLISCDAYVHVPKENKSKLDKKVENVSLLGIKMV
jgi:hypothetical protein